VSRAPEGIPLLPEPGPAPEPEGERHDPILEAAVQLDRACAFENRLQVPVPLGLEASKLLLPQASSHSEVRPYGAPWRASTSATSLGVRETSQAQRPKPPCSFTAATHSAKNSRLVRS